MPLGNYLHYFWCSMWLNHVHHKVSIWVFATSGDQDMSFNDLAYSRERGGGQYPKLGKIFVFFPREGFAPNIQYHTLSFRHVLLWLNWTAVHYIAFLEWKTNLSKPSILGWSTLGAGRSTFQPFNNFCQPHKHNNVMQYKLYGMHIFFQYTIRHNKYNFLHCPHSTSWLFSLIKINFLAKILKKIVKKFVIFLYFKDTPHLHCFF